MGSWKDDDNDGDGDDDDNNNMTAFNFFKIKKLVW